MIPCPICHRPLWPDCTDAERLTAGPFCECDPPIGTVRRWLSRRTQADPNLIYREE